MNRRRRRETFDIKVVGVSEKPNHGHCVVRLVFDIGEHEDAWLLGGRKARKSEQTTEQHTMSQNADISHHRILALQIEPSQTPTSYPPIRRESKSRQWERELGDGDPTSERAARLRSSGSATTLCAKNRQSPNRH